MKWLATPRQTKKNQDSFRSDVQGHSCEWPRPGSEEEGMVLQYRSLGGQ